MSIKIIAIIVSIQLFFIANSFSQQISADQIKTNLKAATVLISNNRQKIPAFFIADKILLTYPKAIYNFIGTTMELNLNNTIISVEFTNATPIENVNHWTLIRLSGQNIASLIYEPLKFADQIPAYPSKIYNYIPFSSFLSNSIIDVRDRTIVTENQFFSEGRAGTPVVNNLGHVFGFFQNNNILDPNGEHGFLELTSFIKVFEKLGANIFWTPIQNSNSGTITSTIPIAVLRGPKGVKIFLAGKTYIVTFISSKHFVIPKSFFQIRILLIQTLLSS
ncbi:MAG: hypothetical protein IPO92_23720 [Saprospiraceae bacterium]|nr:hypothetical protein [Saprospiraceae bacterium]